MTNQSVIERMLDLLVRVERGQLPPTGFEEEALRHFSALENTSQAETNRARALAYELVVACYDEDMPPGRIGEVLADWRQFLAHLPR